MLILTNRTLSEGTLLPRNDDEIFGVYLLESLDLPTLFASLSDPIHPTMLFRSRASKLTSQSVAESSERKQKYQISETTMLSLQSQSHAVVTDASEAELINFSDVFRPQGHGMIFSHLSFPLIHNLSDVEIVCAKLQGTLLPESLRGHIWIHRSLRK
jgi:hypothetical protein